VAETGASEDAPVPLRGSTSKAPRRLLVGAWRDEAYRNKSAAVLQDSSLVRITSLVLWRGVGGEWRSVELRGARGFRVSGFY
jgi:hypothetical protein